MRLIFSKSEYFILRRRFAYFLNEICCSITSSASNNMMNDLNSLKKDKTIEQKLPISGYNIFYYANKNHVNPTMLELTYATIVDFNYGERMLPVICIVKNIEQLQLYEGPILTFASSPHEVNISKTNGYQNLKLHLMDISSGITYLFLTEKDLGFTVLVIYLYLNCNQRIKNSSYLYKGQIQIWDPGIKCSIIKVILSRNTL